ncbi:MAG: Uma2 family endonuclease [Thiobacillus sp.]|nr:Uma2 family endonuclease [Thiobacillus sp.]MDP2977985.1 Uma2 family endonuclease [Thiobacillus sp.]
MSQAHVHSPVEETDYLREEETATSKHEFVGGEIYAMAGASERHNRIAGNIFFHLRSATRGKPCRAFMADMKLRLAGGATYYYPDAMLVCDPDDDHPIYKHSPCLIAEVLSPATATVDVREKWAAYRGLASLRYYLLVDSERLWAKVFFLDEHDAWFEQELSAEDRIDVACDGTRLTLTLDNLYEDTGLLVV